MNDLREKYAADIRFLRDTMYAKEPMYYAAFTAAIEALSAAQPEGGEAVESCPKCGGDCGSANPPVAYCPMREAAPKSPSYDALLIIAQSVCGALKRAGFDDCDDPGEAIDVMREGYERRLSRPAPAQQAVTESTAWMLDLANEIKANAEDHPAETMSRFALGWADTLAARAITSTAAKAAEGAK